MRGTQGYPYYTYVGSMGNMGKLFFTSDLHLNHDFVARTRDYGGAVEHDEALIDRWNSVVTKRDQVWVLGDVSMSGLTREAELTSRLNGIKHLVFGNHDGGHPMHRGAHNKHKRYLEVFATVQTVAQLRVAGRKVSLSHFPYGGDHSGTDRFDEWRLRPSSTPLLCGHVHQAWVYNSNQFNVGQDFNPSLVTQDQVEAWIEGARPVTSGHIRRRIRALGETA